MGLNHALPEISETNFYHLVLHGNDPTMITLLEMKSPWVPFRDILNQIQKIGKKKKLFKNYS